jgi:hypothetical protein
VVLGVVLEVDEDVEDGRHCHKYCWI